MARNKAIGERVQALVAELLAEEAATDLEGRRENINDMALGQNLWVELGVTAVRRLDFPRHGSGVQCC